MYRPEGFELLVWQRIDKLLDEWLIYGDVDDHEAQLFSYGVEAGADAMLEALIKQGRFNYAGYGTTDFPDARWGWFVFIPEG